MSANPRHPLPGGGDFRHALPRQPDPVLVRHLELVELPIVARLPDHGRADRARELQRISHGTNRAIPRRQELSNLVTLSVLGGTLNGMWSPLNDTEKNMLRLEAGWFKYAGAKDQQINQLFHLTPTKYYAQLNQLIDRPEALAWDPMTVKRLQRLREARRQQRSSTRLA